MIRMSNNTESSPRKIKCLMGLASASVLLSVAACSSEGPLSIENIDAALADGEDVEITISTNEDGDLVIGSTADGDGDAAAGEGAIYALTNQFDPSIQISAPEDAESIPDAVNSIVAFSRDEDGVLTEIGVYDTGGLGENIRNSGANPLATQDPLIVSKDNRFVFAVNAGSESISSFSINDDFTLTPASLDVSTVGATGGQNPASLTIFENILYVANTGNYVDENGVELETLPQDRTRVNSSIIGFTIGEDGTLTELPGSEVAGGLAANAGAIEFSADGRFLYVTERMTDNIVSISLGEDFVPIVTDSSGDVEMSVTASITPGPFGTDLYPAENGTFLLVSESNDGAAGLSALSSYELEEDGSLTGISLSSGVEGDPLVTGHTFGCWVEFVETPNGDFAYVSNTPDGVITSYAVGDEGGLTLLESSAGLTNIEGDDENNGVGILDVEIVFPYLYQVVNNDGRLAQFKIEEDGSLTRMVDVEATSDLFVTGMFNGVAGF